MLTSLFSSLSTGTAPLTSLFFLRLTDFCEDKEEGDVVLEAIDGSVTVDFLFVLKYKQRNI